MNKRKICLRSGEAGSEVNQTSISTSTRN